MKIEKLFVAALLAALVAVAGPARAAVNAETVQKLTKAGVATSYVSGLVVNTDSYTFTNNGRTFLYVKKTGAGSSTFTFNAQATYQGLPIGNQTVVVPATTGDVFIGPFPASVFNDASQNVTFSFTDDAGLSFALLSL